MKTQHHFVLLAGVAICCVTLFQFSKTAKPSGASRLTKAQMAAIRGNGESGCVTFTDTVSCKGANLVFNGPSCPSPAVVMRPQGKYESNEQYQNYISGAIPDCSNLPFNSGIHNMPFESAKTGNGENTLDVVENGVNYCRHGIICSGGGGANLKKDPDDATKCKDSDNPLSYCAACSSSGDQLLPKSRQPKKYKCDSGG